MEQRHRLSTSSLESFARPEPLGNIQSTPVSPSTSTQAPGYYRPHDVDDTQQFTIDLNDLESTTDLQQTQSKLATNLKEELFLAENNETNGWINGYSVPYSLLRYGLASDESTKIELDYDHGDVQYFFNPVCHLNEIEHSAFGRKDSNVSTSNASSEDTDQNKEQRNKFIQNQDETIHAYSGYITIPKISFNIPYPYRNNKKQLRAMSDVPRICFQNAFVVGDVTYVFGGLSNTKQSTFHHIGLPLNIDINKVSIHFPYKVPPFVDSKMLTTPFLHPNPHFIAYNAIRGTVTFVNTQNLKHFPGHLLSMQSTQITAKHYFFYGGFEIQNLSVKYHADIDRWIIRKQIVMNEDGYILDSSNLKFIKIRLEPNKMNTSLGRIGMGICSNIYQPPNERGEKISVGGEFNRPFENQKQPLPQAFSEASHKSNPSDHSASVSVTRSNTKKANFERSRQDVKQDDGEREHQPLPQREPKTEDSPMMRTKQSPTLQRIVTTHSIDSSLSDAVTRTSSASTSSPSSSKMDKIKSKFHRPNLKNTYSEKVREHRSNSTNNRSGSSSRAVSPILNASSHSSNLNPTTIPTATPVTGSTSLDSATTTNATPANPASATNSSILSPPTTLTPEASLVCPTVSNRPITPILQLQNKHSGAGSDGGTRSGHSTPPDDGARQSPKRNEREVLEFVRSYSRGGSSKSRSRGGSRSGEFLGAIEEDDDETNNSATFSDGEECFETRTRSSNPLFNDSNILSNVSVFVFGGFYLDDDIDNNGIQHFKATNDMLKIDLTAKDEPMSISNFTFLPDALVSKVGSDPANSDIVLDEDENWPSPRGYFASYMIDYSLGLDERCELDVGKYDLATLTPFQAQAQAGMIRRSGTPEGSVDGSAGSFQVGGGGGIGSGPGTGTAPSLATSGYEEPSEVQSYFDKRSFIIQGGCAEGNQFFADFYRFIFETCKWEKFTTYAYDYFNIPLEPGADDDGSLYTKENMVPNPELKEAELRCCHHTCVYYQNEERDYLFFLGGVKSDHLRFFDEVPYKSNKFDVSRLSKLPLMTNNTNTMRIAVLNIQTQTWRFMRYYYDINHAISDSYLDRVMEHPSLVNARISHLAGSTTMTGKTLTLAQGLVIIAPEKKEDLVKLRKEIPTDEMLWGGIIQLTFAGL